MKYENIFSSFVTGAFVAYMFILVGIKIERQTE